MPEPDSRDVAAHPRLVTPKVAAEYCGVHPYTIRRWVQQGRLEGYRTGPKLIRVDLDAVEALVVPVVPS
ncbi:helix-turn-helix domain-containing protein [Mycobacterium sp. AT1]|uniref:helix-turn-helix domain-containing protein n=1 Tax=Mycobacterium sp. AT1 TaxID=1961706 RepID=UPI0009AEB745|nr:helix-turn-helix domain-containing protein [Mycobacterium sp. AT1]OPX12002.1 hypothetical protein B1790_06060 [Mycobacterium sp. AT1]